MASNADTDTDRPESEPPVPYGAYCYWKADDSKWTTTWDNEGVPPPPASYQIRRWPASWSDIRPEPTISDSTDFKYPYLPLNPSRKEIRILVLDPPVSDTGTRRTLISGSLVHVSLIEKPKFQAISYTWGEPTPLRTILLDGYLVQIRENLWAALDHILSDAHGPAGRRGFHFAWADSICIDQTSIREKNQQVPLMASIYSTAFSVLAWLGPATPNDLIAMKRMAEIHATYTDAIYQPENQPDWAVMARDEGPTYHAFHALLRKPYWRRVWTQQEMAFAMRRRELYFCCGETGFYAFILNSVCRFYSVMERYLTGPDDRKAMGGKGEIFDRRVRTDVWNRMLRTCDPSKPTPMKSVIAIGGLTATDPRDHVYGFLAIADDADVLGIELDYGKEARDVFVDFAMAYLKRGDLDLMACSQLPKLLPGLPSWVPDWTGSIAARPGTRFEPSARQNACGETKARVSFLSRASNGDSGLIAGPPILCLDGVRLGEIKHAGTWWNDSRLADTGDIFLAVRVLNDLLTVMSNYQNCHVTCRDYPSIVFGVPIGGTFELRPPGQDPDDEGLEAGTIPRPTDIENLQLMQESFFALGELRERLYQMEYQHGTARAATDGSKRHGFLDDPDLTELAERAMAYGSLAVQHSMVMMSRFFITVGGHVGMGPYYLDEGDVLCIMYGAQVPYLLRPADEERYTFVGTAYVHDCMHGSTMRSGQEGETFRII